ncbi:MAG TPA: N-acetylmuramoyl-L-alanine amidase, partial [Gaiellaceae bacterium]|nr:N-acetylmuramoyl-L-alanine amidase [Gaiellaceae bacterium]
EGRWSAWLPAAPEEEDGPDPRSREARSAAGWRVGNPWWTGPADAVQARALGRVRAIRAHLVWSPEVRVPYRTLALAGAPPIVPRAAWGADESIRRGRPAYAPQLRFAVVHHTAGRNDYSRAEAAAIVRGIQLYHVRANGWNDIGYNFLVDRFGTVYEGRFGGIERNVVGAHAQGFNTGSVGVALLGSYGRQDPSAAALDAAARLLAWRLDLAHVDPAGLVTVLSGGNPRFPAGVPVALRVVSGHRDTGFTECPGDALYARLDALAGSAAALGLPKIYDPQVETSEGVFRFRARLSSPLPWTVAITGSGGVEAARGEGSGRQVDWSWDASGAAGGVYRWTIRAGTARPASGPLTVEGASAPLAVEDVTADVAGVTPNGDGQADTATISFRLTKGANVTVELRDAAGAVAATVLDRVWKRAGPHSVVADPAALPDGQYTVAVTARTAVGEEAQGFLPLAVSRVLGLVTAAPRVVSPNGDGRSDRLSVSFALAGDAAVSVRILREGRWVASPFAADLPAGVHRVVWDGSQAGGPLPDGAYTAVVEAADAAAAVSVAVPFFSDTTPPSVRILPGRPLRVAVSEPVALALRIDGRLVRRRVARAGVVRVPWPGPALRVRAVAWDAAGNTSGPVLRVARP